MARDVSVKRRVVDDELEIAGKFSHLENSAMKLRIFFHYQKYPFNKSLVGYLIGFSYTATIC